VGKKQTESGWNYPRPPRVEAFAGLIEIRHLRVDREPKADKCRGKRGLLSISTSCF